MAARTFVEAFKDVGEVFGEEAGAVILNKDLVLGEDDLHLGGGVVDTIDDEIVQGTFHEGGGSIEDK